MMNGSFHLTHCLSVLLCIAFLATGCGPSVYQETSFASPSKAPSKYEYVIVVHPDVSVHDGFANNGSFTGQTGGLSGIFEGLLLKAGLNILLQQQISNVSDEVKRKTIVGRWIVSDRNDRLMGLGYSQEVTVTFTDFLTAEIVYRGVGEAMDDTHSGELKAAIESAMKGFAR